ncbi:MAG: hypothetical protein H7249_14450 [Chitinophagaceae bacterium]|nr:hypothetical protein [Oligoflexus sp.]
MGMEILRQSTQKAMRECVLSAVDRYGFDLERSMRQVGLIDSTIRLVDTTAAITAFDMFFEEIDWRDRQSILPVIPIFEGAYVTSPRNFASAHNYLDGILAHDGYRMKEARLVRLPM